jgi:hypothetical protein
MTSSPNSGQKEHRKLVFLYFCCPGSPDFPEVSPEINKNLLLAAFRLPENCRTAVDKLSGSCRHLLAGRGVTGKSGKSAPDAHFW